MPLRSQNPGDAAWGYQYDFEGAGKPGRFVLTYRIDEEPEARALLLISHASVCESQADKDTFQALAEHKRYHASNTGRYGAAKCLVNSIVKLAIPNAGVAVHKFGPVPVAILEEPREVEFNGRPIQCQVGVYPSVGSRNKSVRPPGVTNKEEFLATLTLRLDVQMRRYLEDAGEHLFDIEYHSDLIGALSRSKACETVLGGSIQTKLDAICARSRSPSHAAIRRLQQEIREEYAVTLFRAKFGRNFTLFLLNELYEAIGIRKKGRYANELGKALQKGDEGGYFEKDSSLRYLKECYQDYNDARASRTVLEARVPSEGKLWVQRLVGFARFVGMLHWSAKSRDVTRVFVSYHHKVPVSEFILHHLRHLGDDFLEVLSVRDEPATVGKEESIRAKIWLGDAVYAVIPKNSTAAGDDRPKGYSWIAKECYHALLLKRQVAFLEEEGTDRTEVASAFADANVERLAPSARRYVTASELVAEYEKSVALVFRHASLPEIDLALLESVQKFLHKLGFRRTVRLLRGWLCLFPPGTAKELLRANRVLRVPHTSAEAARAMWGPKAKGDKFTNLWRKAKARALVIRGVERPIIAKTAAGSRPKYSGSLPSIVGQLLPSPAYDQAERESAVEVVFTNFGFPKEAP